ncbi:hypothetical protein AGABI2DRAFT_117458 [Agaricus bisporus var. bisporus H97]|uniref:hypothetical protein n=1 Tax=Agaricus bisporus var. bisporus (strain H97 / ATCC MYA-4626 / FGSC 10389) TaxID=936046 RepID=UPI00029F67F1|nr:hypothetical protein AGABI2DRAFT_117458 [Agaricus bisporus var. bisporus H97]EKV48653.1 hypothetical protein AGABI2DRAFT_117458 [Agaricus bisporus var. bisporus H97]
MNLFCDIGSTKQFLDMVPCYEEQLEHRLTQLEEELKAMGITQQLYKNTVEKMSADYKQDVDNIVDSVQKAVEAIESRQEATSQQICQIRIDLRDIQETIQKMSRELEEGITRRIGDSIGSLAQQLARTQSINQVKGDELTQTVQALLATQAERGEDLFHFKSLVGAQLATIHRVCNGLEQTLQGLSEEILHRHSDELQELGSRPLAENSNVRLSESFARNELDSRFVHSRDLVQVVHSRLCTLCMNVSTIVGHTWFYNNIVDLFGVSIAFAVKVFHRAASNEVVYRVFFPFLFLVVSFFVWVFFLADDSDRFLLYHPTLSYI